MHTGDCPYCECPTEVEEGLDDARWQELRKLPLVRAEYRCEYVESGRRCFVLHEPPQTVLDVHHRLARVHIDEAAKMGQDIHGINNLVVLCRHHHEIETASERQRDWPDVEDMGKLDL